MESENYE
jgi:hypothetical protein